MSLWVERDPRTSVGYDVQWELGEWNEEDHPRADRGRFGEGGGDSKNYALTDKIPPAPGTVPIPAGDVRLYHVTNIRREPGDERPWHEIVHGRAVALREEGIRADRARGEQYGEPSVVWGQAGKPIGDFEENVVVEYHVPVDKLDIGQYYGQGGSAEEHARFLEERHSSVTLPPGVSVPPSEIVAVHEPWHDAYRYFQDNPEEMADVLSGMHDSLAKDDPVRYGPAIERVKAEALRASALELAEWNEDDHPRDDNGRFGGGGGGDKNVDTAVKVEGWTIVTYENAVTAARDRLSEQGVLNPGQLRDQLSDMQGRTIWMSDKGDQFISFEHGANVSPEDQAKLVATFDDLYKNNPLAGTLNVGVLPTAAVDAKGNTEPHLQGEAMSPGTFGMTFGMGTIYLNANVFTPEGQSDVQRSVKAGWFPAAAGKVDAAQYIATHEYGHALQRSNDTPLVESRPTPETVMVKQWTNLHDYGYAKTSLTEGYAEAFATFQVSGANDIPLRALAEREGWKR